MRKGWYKAIPLLLQRYNVLDQALHLILLLLKVGIFLVFRA